MNTKEKDLTLAGVCGVYCEGCSVYIGTHEDKERLEGIARAFGLSVEEMKCNGCRSDKISAHCKSCNFRECAGEKNISFCSECQIFPCDELKEFQKQMPHRIELWDSLEVAKEKGLDAWMEKNREDYKCQNCHTLNSAYDIKCRKCGEIPGNNFIKRNRVEIENYLKNR